MQIQQDVHLDKNLMRKIATLMLLCLASMLSDAQAKLSGLNVDKVVIINDVRFDISTRRIHSFKEAIEIKAIIFNNNIDTIYFLTSTCEGEQYSLRYDTAKFILTPFMNCNASYPRLQKLLPKGQHDFIAHFRFKDKETEIKLGFDFYHIAKSIDLSKIGLGDIHNRPTKDQNVLWADEKKIK